jgi:hypothetical protein
MLLKLKELNRGDAEITEMHSNYQCPHRVLCVSSEQSERAVKLSR